MQRYYFKFIILLFIGCLSFFLGTLSAQIAKTNGIEIWYETFGEKKNPPLLLIMGAGGQAIIWPDDFCMQLSQRGFYVIRYDQRDSGFSSRVDFTKNPYDLLDLASDAIGILDALQIHKVHIFGLSMGGAIAELMAVHFPERVETIALMGSHFDYRPYTLALDGLPKVSGFLSSPREEYFLEVRRIMKLPSSTIDEKIEKKMQIWRLLNGTKYPLDEIATRKMHCEYFRRSVNPENLINYHYAIKRSEEMVQAIHSKVLVPTVIFQGSEDPILRDDHAKALHKAIQGSRYFFVKGMGHLPNRHFFEFLINKIEQNIRAK